MRVHLAGLEPAWNQPPLGDRGFTPSKLIHSVEVTPANIHDAHALPFLLHGEDRRVWGDLAYAGQAAVLSVCAPHARDFTHRRAML